MHFLQQRLRENWLAFRRISLLAARLGDLASGSSTLLGSHGGVKSRHTAALLICASGRESLDLLGCLLYTSS